MRVIKVKKNNNRKLAKAALGGAVIVSTGCAPAIVTSVEGSVVVLKPSIEQKEKCTAQVTQKRIISSEQLWIEDNGRYYYLTTGSSKKWTVILSIPKDRLPKPVGTLDISKEKTPEFFFRTVLWNFRTAERKLEEKGNNVEFECVPVHESDIVIRKTQTHEMDSPEMPGAPRMMAIPQPPTKRELLIKLRLNFKKYVEESKRLMFDYHVEPLDKALAEISKLIGKADKNVSMQDLAKALELVQQLPYIRGKLKPDR